MRAHIFLAGGLIYLAGFASAGGFNNFADRNSPGSAPLAAAAFDATIVSHEASNRRAFAEVLERLDRLEAAGDTSREEAARLFRQLAKTVSERLDTIEARQAH